MKFLRKCFVRSSVAATGLCSSTRGRLKVLRLRTNLSALRASGYRLRQCYAAEPLGGHSLLIACLFVAALPRLTFAQVIISEIMYDAPGSDSKAEWVELQNTGDSAIDISKWKFNDGSNHVLNAPPKNGSTGSLVMQPGEYLVLAGDANTFNSSHSVSVSVIDTVMNLSNDSGKLSLLDASSSVEYKISYTSSRGGNGTGESLQLVSGKLVAAKPTPGYANSSARIAKASPTPVPAKTSSEKVAIRTSPEILDGTSTVAAGVTDAQNPPPVPMTAAAVVPLNAGSNPYATWIYSALALGIAGAAAFFIMRHKRNDEWDIEEIQ